MCVAIEPPRNAHPCIPSPCGPNSECRELDARAVCSCGMGMLGAPPNCRPECIIHQECPSNRACISQRCQDPCVGSCGFNARCTTQNHQPICSCMDGYDGDPYASCTPRQSEYHNSPILEFRQSSNLNRCNQIYCAIVTAHLAYFFQLNAMKIDQ